MLSAILAYGCDQDPNFPLGLNSARAMILESFPDWEPDDTGRIREFEAIDKSLKDITDEYIHGLSVLQSWEIRQTAPSTIYHFIRQNSDPDRSFEYSLRILAGTLGDVPAYSTWIFFQRGK